MTISMSKVQTIRQLKREGESIAGISRIVGVSRDTVYKYLEMDDFSPEMPARKQFFPAIFLIVVIASIVSSADVPVSYVIAMSVASPRMNASRTSCGSISTGILRERQHWQVVPTSAERIFPQGHTSLPASRPGMIGAM